MGVEKNKIWLINQYAMPPQFESRLRTIKFAHYLTLKGYDVIVFASSVMHNMNKNLIIDSSLYLEQFYGNLHFVHINTVSYKSNGLRRIWSMLQFPHRLKKIAHKFNKPDVIIHTATVPFGNRIYFLAKKFKAQYIVEVLDLWPQSFVDLGLISKKNPLLYLAYSFEKWLYKKADKLVFSMEGGKDYVIEKKWDTLHGGPINLSKIFYINNGVDLDEFHYNQLHYKLEDIDLMNNFTKKIIYIGSIRLANNMIKLIEAAEYFKNDSSVKFLIYGDGDDRQNLENYCKQHLISNVIFKEKWVDPKFVPYILSRSNINILNYMPEKFGNFGGSQSKMFQYIASGKPICCNLKMKYCIITKNKLGIAKEFSSSKEYAEAINHLLQLNQNELNSLYAKSQKVINEFDYRFLTEKLISIFNYDNTKG